jgi:hypothetical protein
MVEVTEYSAAVFENHFFNARHSKRAKDYLNLVHTLKGEVANSHWNDNDKPAGEAERHPRAEIADPNDTTSPYYILLTRESAARSIPLSAMVGAVKGVSDIQIGCLDDLEELRSPYNDQIKTERDKETVPGTKDNNYSAVDAIVTLVKSAIDTAAAAWTPVQ